MPNRSSDLQNTNTAVSIYDYTTSMPMSTAGQSSTLQTFWRERLGSEVTGNSSALNSHFLMHCIPPSLQTQLSDA